MVEAGRLLRAARREAGLSQRALGERAGTGRHVVADAEAGHSSPRYDVLVSLLASCGQELVMRPRPPQDEPPDEDELVAWLRRSVTERLARTCGQAYVRAAHGTGPWVELARLGSLGRLSAVEGPLAYGAWVPGLSLVGEQPLVAHGWPRGTDAALPFVVVGSAEAPPGSLVRVPLPWFRSLRSVLWLPPPDALLDTAPPQLREPLRRAAQLLHERGPRDRAGRRPAAHREPDMHAELHRWQARYATGAPPLTDSRDWRLDGAGSFAELARRSRARRLPYRDGWSRWGWR